MKIFRTGDQTWVREHNLSLVLKQLWEANEPIKRSRLTRITGLNKSTVGSLLNELVTMGFVRWVGYSESSEVGRPASLIEINPDGGRFIGIEIGKDFISLVVSDLKAKILWMRKTTNTLEGSSLDEVSASQLLKQTEILIADAIADINQDDSPLLGIGVGIPGMIDLSTKKVLHSNVLEWELIEIRERFSKRFQVPVYIGNDADVSTLGEWMIGVAKNVNNFIYISSNVGIGGGLVLDGRLHRGENGFAGEIGHISIDTNGPRCFCGNYGCLEMYIRPKSIVDNIKKAAEEGRTPILMEICKANADSIGMKTILQAADLGDTFVLEFLNQVACYLGAGIANLIYILDPKMIVIGGVLSEVGPFFHAQIEQEVKDRLLDDFRPEVLIMPSINGFDACAVGGVALVIDALLQNPGKWPLDQASHDHLIQLTQ